MFVAAFYIGAALLPEAISTIRKHSVVLGQTESHVGCVSIAV